MLRNSDEPSEVAKLDRHLIDLSTPAESVALWRKHFNVRVSDLHVLEQVYTTDSREDVKKTSKLSEQNFSLILKSVELS